MLPNAPRTLALVSLASLGWAVSFGLLSALAPLWLRSHGQSAGVIGLNTSLYYLGVAVTAPFVPWLMRRAGRNCVLVGMVGDALTTALFPYAGGALGWHLLRFVGGVCTALSLIPMETQVNHGAAPEHRGRDFGIYAFCVALGIALGPAIGLPLYPIGPRLAFLLGGAITFAAIVFAWMGMPLELIEEKKGEVCGPVAWWRHSLGFSTAWVQGFLEGGTFAFLALYLMSRGHSEPLAGVLMAALFAGVVAAQLPMGWLADRLGRHRVLLACHVLLLAGLALVPLSTRTLPLAALLFLVGAACGAMYPLGLALLGERLPREAIGEANAWYLAANCAGSLLGPLVVGLAVEGLGLSALFTVGAAALLLASSAALLPGEPPPVADTRRMAA